MFRIPKATKNLLIVNILAFLAMYVLQLRHIDINDVFGLHFFMASDFHIYQLFTYMFMHANFSHIFFNMFALWMFGCVVERVWGPKKFLFFYISCGVFAGLLQEVAQLVQLYFILHGQDASLDIVDMFSVAVLNSSQLNGWTTVGASGAIYAILLAFGMIFPEERIFIFPLPIPIKAKWFVAFYAILELVLALSTSGDNVAHFAHLGGMLCGFIMIRYWGRHPSNNFKNYGRSNGQQFFDNLKNNWERKKGQKPTNRTTTTRGGEDPDWQYNANKKATQEEIDRILDKIRRSGYDSLTAKEKQTLFDNSNKK